MDKKPIALYIDDGRKNPQELQQFIDFLRGRDYNIVIFLNNLNTFSSDASTPIIHAESMWDFEGPVVAESFLSARFLAEAPLRHMKYFWVRETDWTDPRFEALDQIEVHKNPEILKFCTDKQLFDVYNTVWKNQCHFLDFHNPAETYFE